MEVLKRQIKCTLRIANNEVTQNYKPERTQARKERSIGIKGDDISKEIKRNLVLVTASCLIVGVVQNKVGANSVVMPMNSRHTKETEKSNGGVSRSGYEYGEKAEGAKEGTNNLDIYECTDAKTQTCSTLVYIHGGGLIGGDKRNIGEMPKTMDASNFCLVSVNYPVYGEPKKGLIAQQMRAIESASTWLEKNMNKISPKCTMNNAGIMGHSAGAYLVSLLLTKPTYKDTSNIYRTFILNDSNWYTGKFGRYTEAIKTIFENKEYGQYKVDKIRRLWVPSQLVMESCPRRRSKTNILIMYSKKRAEKNKNEIRLFGKQLQRCGSLNVSMSSHKYTHRGMIRRIGDKNSSAARAVIGILQKSN